MKAEAIPSIFTTERRFNVGSLEGQNISGVGPVVSLSCLQQLTWAFLGK